MSLSLQLNQAVSALPPQSLPPDPGDPLSSSYTDAIPLLPILCDPILTNYIYTEPAMVNIVNTIRTSLEASLLAHTCEGLSRSGQPLVCLGEIL